ncbi:MAG: hypothetical protein AAFX06_24360 [Planctomycetota bacterium]
MKRVFIGTFALLCGLSPSFVIADFIVSTDGDARILTEPSGNRDDNNGGNTITGSLIGRNTGNVDNFMIYDFDSLQDQATAALAANEIVVGATVSVQVATSFSSGTHGDVDDMIILNEIALTNRGFTTGNSTITGADNAATDGSVTFLNRAQQVVSPEAWQDAAGLDQANVLGAISQIGTFQGWNVGDAPAQMTFAVDAVTANDWIDNGLAGFVLQSIDGGNGNARFNMGLNAASISFATTTAIPEPGAAAFLSVLAATAVVRRRRR